MVVEKFPYKTLHRESVNGKRLYSCPNGERLPSVTTILSATKSEESIQALNNWRKYKGAEKAAEITAIAGSRGTRMHKYLENYVQTDYMGEPGTNPYSIQAYHMAKVIVEKGLSDVDIFLGSEVSLYFPGLFAGATDLVGQMKDGELAILDYKQTNRPKKEAWVEDYRCQLCAYALAHNELYGTNIRRGIILMCSGDLEFQRFEVDETNFDKYSDQWWIRVAEYYNISW